MASKGKIEINKLNLMGYTPETQVYFIQNGGGPGTFDFLQANRKHFDHSLFMGRIYFALKANQIEKFKEFAQNEGFEIIEGGRI